MTFFAPFAFTTGVRLGPNTDEITNLKAVLGGTANPHDLTNNLVATNLRADVLDRSPFTR